MQTLETDFPQPFALSPGAYMLPDPSSAMSPEPWDWYKCLVKGLVHNHHLLFPDSIP